MPGAVVYNYIIASTPMLRQDDLLNPGIHNQHRLHSENMCGALHEDGPYGPLDLSAWSP